MFATKVYPEDLFGIEYEFSNINREWLQQLLVNKNLIAIAPNIKFVHDASCETPTKQSIDGKLVTIINDSKFIHRIKDTGVYTYQKYLSVGNNVLGGELVTAHPVKYSTLNKFIQEIMYLFSLSGEPTISDRSGIHVHINVENPSLFYLHSLIRLGLYFEYPYMKLSGMRRINRGITNSFTYQRPLSSPSYVQHGRLAYPVFDVDDLLASNTKTEFWDRFWNMPRNVHSKYQISRYTNINVSSIYKRGSLEFRSCNITMESSDLIAYINFCRAIAYQPFYQPYRRYYKLERNTLDTIVPIEKFEKMLDELVLLSKNDKQILLDVYQETPDIQYKKEYVLTHNNNPQVWDDKYRPRGIPINHAIVPKIIDVRNFNENM